MQFLGVYRAGWCCLTLSDHVFHPFSLHFRMCAMCEEARSPPSWGCWLQNCVRLFRSSSFMLQMVFVLLGLCSSCGCQFAYCSVIYDLSVFFGFPLVIMFPKQEVVSSSILLWCRRSAHIVRPQSYSRRF